MKTRELTLAEFIEYADTADATRFLTYPIGKPTGSGKWRYTNLDGKPTPESIASLDWPGWAPVELHRYPSRWGIEWSKVEPPKEKRGAK